VLGVLPDLRVGADRVPERDLRLGSVSGEDQVLHLTAAVAGTMEAEQLVVKAILFTEGSDSTAEREQFRSLVCGFRAP
jgi:hypothetical protein